MTSGWLNPKLQVAEAQRLGLGLFVRRGEAISAGEDLALLGGHVMTLGEFMQLSDAVHHYPHQINESPDLLLGPMNIEELAAGDYFNHSCNPNAGFRTEMRIVAIRDICEGDQVTIDYATCMTGTFGNMRCSCGARSCRQSITGDDWRMPELQRRYAGFWQPYIQRKIDSLG